MDVSFFELTSPRTLKSFGIDLREWNQNDQQLLHEGMILSLKEHPEWTHEEALAECRRQVLAILCIEEEEEEEVEYNLFEEEYGFLVDRSDVWHDMASAYDTFKEVGHMEFMKRIRRGMEYKEFCDEFYPELRELYNICSAGMYDEFERLKKNGWTHSQYRKDLEAKKKAAREKLRTKN